MSKENGLNQIKNSPLLGKNILLRVDNVGQVASGEFREAWYHEEDTGVDIVLDTPGGVRTYIISMGYYYNLIEEYK